MLQRLAMTQKFLQRKLRREAPQLSLGSSYKYGDDNRDRWFVLP